MHDSAAASPSARSIPNGVGLAACLVFLAGAVGVITMLFKGGANLKTAGVLGVDAILFLLGYGLLRLRAWAYWLYLVLSGLGVLGLVTSTGMLLWGKISPSDFGLPDVIRGLVSLAWTGYFYMVSVRRVFGLGKPPESVPN